MNLPDNLIAFLFYGTALSGCFLLALAVCCLDKTIRQEFIREWKGEPHE